MVGRRSTLVTLASGRLGLVVLLGAWAVLGQASGSSVGDLAESDTDILDVNEPNDIDVGLWSQPPLEIDPNSDPNHVPIFCVWNEPARSTRRADLNRQWRMDADDFRSADFVPITSVRWWGGYKAWMDTTPPELQPMAWHIGIWANTVEDAEPNALFPEQLVWALEVVPDRVGQEPVGMAQYGDKFPERCFVYDVTLEPEEWFVPAEYDSNERVFWISITAIYPDDAEPINLWGWTVRPHLWGRGAVVPAIFGTWPDYDEHLFPGRIYPVKSTSLCGVPQPGDMCFELLTEASALAWSQLLPAQSQCAGPGYVESYGYFADDVESAVCLTADDWIGDPNRPVTAVAWSGYHAGYAYDPCACEPKPDPMPPTYFLLTIWDNEEPTDAFPYPRPGRALWEYRVFDYDQVASVRGTSRLSCRYLAALPQEQWFRPEVPGGRYWLSITAMYPDLAPPDYPWRPTARAYAVESEATSICYIAAGQPCWQPTAAADDCSKDLVFTLFTVP